jgi:hypothetical protein
MSKENPGVIFDASNSWNGYNHQGKLALLLSIKEIVSLYDNAKTVEENKNELSKYFLEIEHLEDFSIGRMINGKEEYLSVHQVKNHVSGVATNYNSAFLGLVYHVQKIPTLKNAYLHSTTDIEFAEKTIKEYLESLVANPKELHDTLDMINKVRSDSAVKREVLAVHKGRPSNFVSKLKNALMEKNPCEKKLNNENIEEACLALEEQINASLTEINGIQEELLDKIHLYTYSFEDTNRNYCEVNGLKDLIIGKLDETISVMGLHSYWKSQRNKERRYLLLLGKLDEHIIERNLNFPLYKRGELDRKIYFDKILEWLICDDIDANDDEFYQYYIKERFADVSNRFCTHCKKKDCEVCLVVSALNKIANMTVNEMKEFLLLTNPNINEEMNMNTYSDYTDAKGIADPFLVGIRDISRPFEADKTAITYIDAETLQSVLTTIILDENLDDVPSICSDIVDNRQLFELLMDCDCFISRNVDAESIANEAMIVGKKFVENPEEIENEHIAKLKKVRMVSLEKFCEGLEGE